MRYDIPLITSAQNFTSSWVDVGPLLDCRGDTEITIFADWTINDSTGKKIRMVTSPTATGTEFPRGIVTVEADEASLQPEYFLIYDDTYVGPISFNVKINSPYVQFQIMCDSVGSTAATLDEFIVVKR